MADTLDEDAVIVEGYAEYATWRPHLAYLRDPYGDPDMEMEIDGVGGVSILAKAKVFRSGVHFPAFSFEKHAETEGFGKVGAGATTRIRAPRLTHGTQMAKRMKFSVVGLPHYTIWHLYEPSVDDIRHMEVGSIPVRSSMPPTDVPRRKWKRNGSNARKRKRSARNG